MRDGENHQIRAVLVEAATLGRGAGVIGVVGMAAGDQLGRAGRAACMAEHAYILKAQLCPCAIPRFSVKHPSVGYIPKGVVVIQHDKKGVRQRQLELADLFRVERFIEQDLRRFTHQK